MILLRKSKKNGIVFFTYIGLYSIGRFIIEGMRTDSLMFGNIRMAQLVSLSGGVIWITFLFFNYYRRIIKERYNYYIENSISYINNKLYGNISFE